jgi:hypothetical protein
MSLLKSHSPFSLYPNLQLQSIPHTVRRSREEYVTNQARLVDYIVKKYAVEDQEPATALSYNIIALWADTVIVTQCGYKSK